MGKIITKEESLLFGDIGNSSHRPLLYLALEETSLSPAPVAEFGMGDGSTPYLHDYCKKHDRHLFSFDHDTQWASRFMNLESPRHMIKCCSWEENQANKMEWSVVLIDHAPEERRHVDIAALNDRASIIVIHDSEPRSTGYQLDKIWPLFKYRADIVVDDPYANATAVSNFFNLSKWDDIGFEGYRYKVIA